MNGIRVVDDDDDCGVSQTTVTLTAVTRRWRGYPSQFLCLRISLAELVRSTKPQVSTYIARLTSYRASSSLVLTCAMRGNRQEDVLLRVQWFVRVRVLVLLTVLLARASQ